MGHGERNLVPCNKNCKYRFKLGGGVFSIVVFCRIQTPIKDILYKEFPRGEVFSKIEFPNLALIGGGGVI